MNTIIIVDNDKEDSDFLVESLIDAGAKADFHCFNSSIRALEYLRTSGDRPSVIISDINLPKVNGLLFKRLIDENEALRNKNIPFIFFSTNISTELLEEALEMHVQGYFQKPDNITDFDIVANKIKHYLDNHPYREEQVLN